MLLKKAQLIEYRFKFGSARKINFLNDFATSRDHSSTPTTGSTFFLLFQLGYETRCVRKSSSGLTSFFLSRRLISSEASDMVIYIYTVSQRLMRRFFLCPCVGIVLKHLSFVFENDLYIWLKRQNSTAVCFRNPCPAAHVWRARVYTAAWERHLLIRAH